MSGIVGIINLYGSPVDRDLLWRMTNSMSYRGPDAQQIWTEANVGFGHTMLRTTWEAATENQPLTLDGKVWLTADARIDGRDELIAKLEAKLSKRLRITNSRNGNDTKGPQTDSGLILADDNPVNDAELLLYAYQAWGENCIKHLIGDFAFAVWDSRTNRLFCARDHMGVRQFYYAQNEKCFVFSNSLKTLRLHPLVTNRLNERAIADFLLFYMNQDPTSTSFADIHRLPQAHSVAVSSDGLRVNEYWTPLVNSPSYRGKDDCVEKFRELLTAAVTDRIRTNSVGISMSGGMDSSSVAAIASQSRNGDSHALDLHAYCVVYDRVFHDDERRYAQIAADAVGIPLQFLEADSINQKDNRRTLGFAPEPFDVDPIYLASDEVLSRISSKSRIALTGWDGDTFMTESPRHYFSWLLRNWKVGPLIANLALYVIFEHRPPPIGLRTFWRRWRNPGRNSTPLPSWINKEFSKKLALVERWKAVNAEKEPAHPIRPRPMGMMFSPTWSALFNRFDAGVTQLPLEVRHPLIDIRLIEYLLALPVTPWLIDKRILRTAITGRLPEEVRLRSKTPLGGDPGLQLRYSKKFRDIDAFRPVSALLNFVERDAIPSVCEETDKNQLWTNVRPFSFNQWLLNSLAMETLNEQ